MHSAKGLEFDHVIIIGYDGELVAHGDQYDDSLRDAHRRLLAMAVGRARQGVVVGFNPADAPSIADLLDPYSYRTVRL
jgi:superfamily I DNA/RNA helicase